MNLHVAAIEIGGTKLQAAVGTPGGDILYRTRCAAPAGEGADAVLHAACDLLDALLAETNLSIASIGVGFGGPVDSRNGTVIVSHQVAGWSGIPLRDRFAERYGVPVSVANDANAAGWGEYRRGSGRGSQTFAYINVGSGIGGALVVDGKLYDGQGLGAFEIGHTRVPSPDGGFAKLEDLASGWSIERDARMTQPERGTPLYGLCRGDAAHITVPMLGEAARAGDRLATRLIEDAACCVGRAMANAVTLVHPEVFAVGGGVSLLGDLFLEPLREELRRSVFEPYRDSVSVVPATLGEDIVLVGALLLAPVEA